MDVCRKLYDISDADTLVILTPSNTRYLSGFASTNCQIIITDKDQYFLTDMRYFAEAKALLGHRYTVLCKTLNEVSSLICGKTIGFEKQITYGQYLELKSISGVGRLVDVSDKISSLRDIKTNEEIELIAQAQKVTEYAFEQALSFIHEGVSEIELAAYIEYNIQKSGCELAFESIVAFGEHTSSPHAHRSSVRLKSGDFITMDIGAKYKGYCSDMTRTVGFGRLSEEQKRTYDCVLGAQLKALESLKADIRGKDGDALARNYFSDMGVGEYFTHSLGHGVGIDIHDGTGLSPKEDRLLKPNMVLTVEPGLYVEGKYGVRIEDMVVIEENSVKNLTNANKQLIIL